MTSPSPLPAPRGAELDGLLISRLRRSLVGSVLEHRTADVVFTAGAHSSWTVQLDRGTARVHRGSVPRPSLTVQADPDVLAQVVSGQSSGVNAFLSGALGVRGDLGLALQLDGMFVGERPDVFPRAREVTALGVRTGYLEAGPPDAPPVILLHGLGATNASMLPLVPDLARDHRVIAPDLPGFGTSDAPPAAYSAAWFAAWVEDLQHVLGARPAVLIGNSLGGRITLEAGITHPRSVRGAVLLCPSPAFRRLRQWIPAVRFLRPELARLPLPTSHRFLVEGIKVMFSKPGRLPESWYDAAADEATRVLRSPSHRVAFFSAARQIYLEDAYGRDGFWDRLPQFTAPSVFVWGDTDRLVPSSFARHVDAVLPDAGAIVLEDCGHVPQFEMPDETVALVRGFLSALSPV